MDPPWAGDPSFGGALPVAHLAGILDDVDMAIEVRERWYDMLVDELTELRIQRNRTVPLISHLIDDILVQIFTLFVNDSWDTRKDQLKITHICRHWRSLALSVPNLWRIICTGRHHECTATFIERSKDQPLSIRMCQGPNVDLEAGFLRLLAKTPDRLQHLQLSVRRSLMIALHEAPYGRAPEHQPDSASILKAVDLTYATPDSEGDTELPDYFWFLSRDTSLPKLEILRLADFPQFITQELLRPTLTELNVDPSECVSVEEWTRLLKTLPVLERLTLGATEAEHGSRMNVPARRLVRMERLRDVCLHRGNDDIGSSLGCAQLLDRLLIPSHAMISISAESYGNAHHAQFALDVLGSKKDGSQCIGEPQPLTALRLEIQGDVYLWSHRRPDQSHTLQSCANSNFTYAIHIHAHSDDDTVQETITDSKLPLNNIEILCIEGITLLPKYLSCFTHLRELHCYHHGHRALLETLASLAPGHLPHLRSLTLERPRWHAHPSGCKVRPFGGQPLSIAIDKLLSSRRKCGIPLEELNLRHVRSFDHIKDAPWLQRMLKEFSSFTCTHCPGNDYCPPQSVCFMCNNAEWRRRRLSDDEEE